MHMFYVYVSARMTSKIIKNAEYTTEMLLGLIFVALNHLVGDNFIFCLLFLILIAHEVHHTASQLSAAKKYQRRTNTH